ncbi:MULTISPECIES: ribonuclease toxin immunity protein CdiI [unclassified Clostridium]|uniref:ribonuclease toxin immunity protein CdiI n=1 Tax=unclassified Clostridium TaxID=2614128 RepID=UPI0013F0DB48|nr:MULTISPECIES: ribonuclease toxin immunity protein CdiI [unclassified Clostridium]NFG61465.1 hypothetical protein [Clostridium botulinum]NFQ10447.1 hypothetical protein [Clostridium botulinum]
MRVSGEKEKYLNYYFDNICFLGKLQISALKTMAEMKGQGAEYISCSFDPDDEDYVEGCVTLFFWKPADDEDTMVVVENSMFYRYLLQTCENHITKYSEDNEKIQEYLAQIKMHLNI